MHEDEDLFYILVVAQTSCNVICINVACLTVQLDICIVYVSPQKGDEDSSQSYKLILHTLNT